MKSPIPTARLAAVLAAAGLVAGSLVAGTSPAAASPSRQFVTAQGGQLTLAGKPYEFAGTNNYYLGYKSHAMVDAVLDDAKAAGFDAIRTWGFQDFQNPDGSGSVQQNFEGVWYQAWDADAGKPVANTGADGLQRLDYAIAAAAKRGIKLIIPFTNNWNAFGGMDQYVRWAGLSTHADFYTSAKIRGWYKDWVATLLNRTNSITGVKYSDDPTILSWELANEPRCTSAGVYPDGTCDTSTITGWVKEMSAYVKTIDHNHLLAVGDEGFFCRPESQWTLTKKYGASGYGAGFGEDCKDGIDTVALASLPGIDLMSMHLYPDSWKVTTNWGTGWIKEHAAAAARIGKPVYLGEFGITDKATRLPVYNTWLRTIRQTGVDGALYWMLASTLDDGTTLYSDYDGYTVYCPSPVCSLITAQASLVPAWSASARTLLETIADNDTLAVQRGESGTVDILANDISLSLPVRPSTLDLDPSTRGRQATRTLTGGTITAAKDGTVTFTGDADFTGKVTFPYTVGNGVTTATANLVVTVRPKPGDPVVLYSWEDGVDGWTPANWQSDPGTLSTGSTGATDGSSALQIASKGAWFGSPTQDPLLDLSARTSFAFDITTADVGTSVSVAVRNGSDWTWCQSSWTWVPADTAETLTIPLDTFGCDASGLTEVHDVLIYVSSGDFAIDRLTVS